MSDEPIRYWFPKPFADSVQKLRVPAGFLLLVTFAWLSQPDARSMLLSLPICLFGLWLRGWAAGHLAKNEQLAISGPYAYMRNPLYAGTLLTAAGIVVASRSASLALIFAAVFLFVYLPAVELEEQHLRSLFPEFRLYAERVGRFLPKRAVHPVTRRFSLALYRRNEEYKAAGGLLLAFAWLWWKAVLL